MFRIDTGLFFQYPIIPNPPTGYTLALIPIPIIPSPGPGPGPTEMMWTSPPVVHVDPSSDEFRMYEFKVTRCPVKQAHDWTVCPWAHPGERARRRDPRRVAYKAIPCEEYRAVQRCRRGDRCEYAHGIFEYWLHPARYRTRACIAGAGCTRSVCFFAHGPEELRAETRYPLRPLRPHEEWANGAGGGSYEVSKSSEGNGGGSSSGSNLVESYDGDYECEMPDLEWISDLIGQD